MKVTLRHVLLVALGVAGSAGLGLIARDLSLAAGRSRDLYVVDTLGSQMVASLEYHVGESRRDFLYMLSTADPNEQLPYIDEVHRSDDAAAREIARLRTLPAAVVKDGLDHFEQGWALYRSIRNRTIAAILEGNAAEAVRLEREEGRQTIQITFNGLRDLNAALALHAQERSALLDRTLARCALEILAFVIAILAILGALLRSNMQRNRAFDELHASHQEVAAAREQEQRRSEILEMVGKHADLQTTLEAVVNLVPKYLPGTGAAIWVAVDGVLRLQAWAAIEGELLEEIKHTSGPQRLGSQELSPTAWLRDASGATIGAIKIYGAVLPHHVSSAAFTEIVRLASLVIENRVLYDQLAFQGQHDPLTGLPNRMLFQDRLQQAIQLARRNGRQVALIWLDLDRYKQINDTLGHRAGDELLLHLAQRLTASVRASDTVARMGGDEFTIVLGDIQCAADAVKVAEKIMETVALPINLGGHEVRITASGGISLYPDHGSDPAALIRNADLAMYSAKHSGRKNCQMFVPRLGESMKRRLEIETDLAAAVSGRELELEYQPIVDSNGTVQSLEALVRWMHPQAGRIPPAEFIPIAEDSGLIFEIGEWVIHRACQDGIAMLNEGCDIRRISINISPKQLMRGDFASVVADAIGAYQFPAERLEFEITESVFTENLESAVSQIEALRLLGVRFSIDDFGTGYSSLSLLGTLPVDTVKIDQAFIRILDSADPGGSTLVSGIIALAHNLRLKVVAEGVETANQLAVLRAMGCDLSQGFLLHRPMPPSDVAKALANPSPQVLRMLQLDPPLA